MSNNTNEEIKKLEEQLELLKQKQEVEDENKQLKEIKDELQKIRKQQELDSNAGCYGCLWFVAIVAIVSIWTTIF